MIKKQEASADTETPGEDVPEVDMEARQQRQNRFLRVTEGSSWRLQLLLRRI